MNNILTLAEPLREQSALLKRFKGSFHDLTKVSSQRIARVEIQSELSEDQIQELHTLLLDGKAEKVRHELLSHSKIFEVAYQAAVLDPEHTAIQKMLNSLKFGEQIVAVKMATVYAFEGLTEEQAKALVHKYLYNEILNVLIHPGAEQEALLIKAEAEPTEIVAGFREMNLRELKELSEERSLYMEDHYLEEAQRKFRDDLQRDPTDAELEYLAQRTSDHCFHTTWKSLGLFKELKKEVDKVLPKRPDIVSVFVDNSGVMAADDTSEMTYMIKGETHNSPTAIAPVGGVETMHGGCLRDIMGTGQGGYPTMASQVFIIGDQTKEEMNKKYEVDSFLDPLVILRGMVEGVRNYGNPMGVPNFGGRIFRHPQFFGKPLALGICLGIGERKYSKIGTPEPGDIALLVGNPTGRDGIHGATMSSAASSEEMIKKEGAAVQIGDPYTERLIMEATPKLRHLLRAYGDLGAGGIASCFGEMAEGVGIEMDLKNIPTKYEGLAAWEKLESEAQERMGMAVAPERLDEVKAILDLHEVPYFELGTFTGTERLVVKHGEETIVDLDYEWLESFPIPQKNLNQWVPEHGEVKLEEHLDGELKMKEAVLQVLTQPELADQSLFTRRWDSTVQGKSLRESSAPFTNMPYDQGITVPDPETGLTQVLSLTVNPYWAGNPYNMARATFAGTVSKQIAAGVKRKKIAMCDNFYTPKSRDEIDFKLTEMVRGINEMMADLETPMISGKDSSSGTTKMTKRDDGKIDNFEIAPTICMSAMGAGENAMKVPAKAFQKAGNKLFFVHAGVMNDDSGNILLKKNEKQHFLNFEINISTYTETIDRLAELIDAGNISSISVLDDGGMVHRLFEMMLGSGLGASITPNQEIHGTGSVTEVIAYLTRVLPGAFLIEVESAEMLEGLDAVEIGTVTEAAELNINGDKLSLEEMKNAWHAVWYEILQIPREHEEIEAPQSVLPFSASNIAKKKVNVVYSAGINCHQEMVRCWEMLGCDTNLISVTDPNAKFADADIVVFPGGFADGDYLGSAKVWHRLMETQFVEQMNYLRSGKVPVLGICNGFQLMTRSGFFGENLKLTFNDTADFEQRWVKVRLTEESANSIWTKGLEGKELIVPIAHGEGKFLVKGEMDKATVSMVYSPNEYPNNPNGSTDGIAGVFAGDQGQFWGGMPHPERAIENYHFSQHGLLFFENVLRNLSDGE
jgi:phosphoribosylformylglycinamidine synthase II